MKTHVSKQDENAVVLNVIATGDELSILKKHILEYFQTSLRLPGFRAGKTPLELVEKNIDSKTMQSRFLEEAINQFYPHAINSENLKPIVNPEISIKKFVPYTELEFEAKLSVIGNIKLADYKKIKKKIPTFAVSDDEVDNVIDNLLVRSADRTDVDRASKNGDEVWIDFEGKDSQGKPIPGADGKSYPLVLGSNTFIPGFEEKLIGLKAGEKKEFTITFPKDYGSKKLAGAKVKFLVTVIKVQDVKKPKMDKDFVAKIGPFKSVAQLKDDVKIQLSQEKKQQAMLNYESELVREITAKSEVNVPEILISNQVERMLAELKKNLTYKGQTYDEFLDSEKTNNEDYQKKVLRPAATERVKASLVLAEIADSEKIEVTEQELEVRMQILKGQHKDSAMQDELNKPEARQDIASRMLSEKTVAKLAMYANSL
jgi:trigger factor